MNIENLVVFKGSVDGIVVYLDENAPFEAIVNSLKEKLHDAKKFFSGAKVSVRFKGRCLSLDEQDKLLEILTCQNTIDVSFVHEFTETITDEKDEQIRWIMRELVNPNTSFTYFHYGMVRSGQEINYRGSVVVLGDVNPGAVIKADDNIVILGNLKGKVHAGINPTVKIPFVLAVGMYPVQIGIKNIIAQSPEEELINEKKVVLPQIAYINNEQIYVEEIDFKTLNHMVE